MTKLRGLSLAAALVVGCGESEGGGRDERGCPDEPGAADLVTGAACDRLAIEVDQVAEQAARAGALDRLREQLTELTEGGQLGKPQGVAVAVDEADVPAAEPEHVYTFDEIATLFADHRSYERGAGEAVVHVLYLDGRFEDDTESTRVLGFAFGGFRIAMFREALDGGCARAGPLIRDKVCELTEASVLVHEAGHLLGLVDNGTPMVADHKDEAHGAHDVNEQCIMYWLAETEDIAALIADRLSGGDDDVSPFDAACLEDLAAAQ